MTNWRVFHQGGILGKSYVDCPLSMVRTLYTDMTVWGRLFKFGAIRIALADATGVEISWENPKDPVRVHGEINEAVERSNHV